MKSSHQNAAVVRNATTKASVRAASSSSSAVVAPVITIDSPSAMMMKSWKRSAKCSEPTSQASGVTRGRPGTQNVIRGAA